MAKNQHFNGQLTNIEWLKAQIRLRDVAGEVGGGARIICMPFAKAAGVSLSDHVTLAQLRPDLLLPDDVQAHDDASSPRITEKLIHIWNNSVKYLGGRRESTATCFTQTVFAPEDMADQLSRDPSVHTVRYEFLESFPTNMDWWLKEYKPVLLGYDPLDENGQVKAREAAKALYLANKDKADGGAKVSWEHVYDPSSAASAIEQAMRNFLSNVQAFFSQDQNNPQGVEDEGDIGCKPSEIMRKMHAKRKQVPDFADKLVAHIDVQDSLLYWAVVGGSSTMQAGLIDRQTWLRQQHKNYSLRNAVNAFDTDARYAGLPTKQDRIKVALRDLVTELLSADYVNAEGVPVSLSAIGVDCGDGDHFDSVHAFVRESKNAVVVPMRGVGLKASETPINKRPKAKSEKRRGDHWAEKLSERTKVKWLEYDANYWKSKVHHGLKSPVGTSESLSLWHATDDREHYMVADHCNAETAVWVTARRAYGTTTGAYEWKLKPGADNHTFDNLGCSLVLLNYTGSGYVNVLQNHPKKRRVVKGSEMIRQRRLAAASRG